VTECLCLLKRHHNTHSLGTLASQPYDAPFGSTLPTHDARGVPLSFSSLRIGAQRGKIGGAARFGAMPENQRVFERKGRARTETAAHSHTHTRTGTFSMPNDAAKIYAEKQTWAQATSRGLRGGDVAISVDGRVAVFGSTFDKIVTVAVRYIAHLNDGAITYPATTTEVIQQPQPPRGNNEGDDFGCCVGVSASGKTIAVGGRYSINSPQHQMAVYRKADPFSLTMQWALDQKLWNIEARPYAINVSASGRVVFYGMPDIGKVGLLYVGSEAGGSLSIADPGGNSSLQGVGIRFGESVACAQGGDDTRFVVGCPNRGTTSDFANEGRIEVWKYTEPGGWGRNSQAGMPRQIAGYGPVPAYTGIAEWAGDALSEWRTRFAAKGMRFGSSVAMTHDGNRVVGMWEDIESFSPFPQAHGWVMFTVSYGATANSGILTPLRFADISVAGTPISSPENVAAWYSGRHVAVDRNGNKVYMSIINEDAPVLNALTGNPIAKGGVVQVFDTHDASIPLSTRAEPVAVLAAGTEADADGVPNGHYGEAVAVSQNITGNTVLVAAPQNRFSSAYTAWRLTETDTLSTSGAKLIGNRNFFVNHDVSASPFYPILESRWIVTPGFALPAGNTFNGVFATTGTSSLQFEAGYVAATGAPKLGMYQFEVLTTQTSSIGPLHREAVEEVVFSAPSAAFVLANPTNDIIEGDTITLSIPPVSGINVSEFGLIRVRIVKVSTDAVVANFSHIRTPPNASNTAVSFSFPAARVDTASATAELFRAEGDIVIAQIAHPIARGSATWTVREASFDVPDSLQAVSLEVVPIVAQPLAQENGGRPITSLSMSVASAPRPETPYHLRSVTATTPGTFPYEFAAGEPGVYIIESVALILGATYRRETTITVAAHAERAMATVGYENATTTPVVVGAGNEVTVYRGQALMFSARELATLADTLAEVSCDLSEVSWSVSDGNSVIAGGAAGELIVRAETGPLYVRATGVLRSARTITGGGGAVVGDPLLEFLRVAEVRVLMVDAVALAVSPPLIEPGGLVVVGEPVTITATHTAAAAGGGAAAFVWSEDGTDLTGVTTNSVTREYTYLQAGARVAIRVRAPQPVYPNGVLAPEGVIRVSSVAFADVSYTVSMPRASFSFHSESGPGIVVAGIPVAFLDTSFPQAKIAAGGRTWDWSEGGATLTGNNGDTYAPAFTFHEEKLHVVTLTVRFVADAGVYTPDGAPYEASARRTIPVGAETTFDFALPRVPWEPVKFRQLSLLRPKRTAWTFGDGATAEFSGAAAPTTVLHAYDAPGLYTVTMAATFASIEPGVDDFELPPKTRTLRIVSPTTIDVEPPRASAAALSGAAAASAGAVRVLQDDVVRFTAHVAATPTASYWVFGDGPRRVVDAMSVRHAYASAGAFTAEFHAVYRHPGTNAEFSETLTAQLEVVANPEVETPAALSSATKTAAESATPAERGAATALLVAVVAIVALAALVVAALAFGAPRFTAARAW
jgi:PKD repeat protein